MFVVNFFSHIRFISWRRKHKFTPKRWKLSTGLYDVIKQDHIKVKWSHYRPGIAHRVGRGIALLFHDRGTRRGWVVSSTPRPHFTPGKDQVPILQEAGWATGPVWTGGKSRPHRDSIPDRPARSSVTIPTELPGPQTGPYRFQKLASHTDTVCSCSTPTRCEK